MGKVMTKDRMCELIGHTADSKLSSPWSVLSVALPPDFKHKVFVSRGFSDDIPTSFNGLGSLADAVPHR